MMKNKILTELAVKSFMTTLDHTEEQVLNGGKGTELTCPMTKGYCLPLNYRFTTRRHC